MVVIGFSGTRWGMTDPQKSIFRELLIKLGATELHLGDCIGGDKDAHGIGRELNLKLIGHPPTDPKLRAFLEYDDVYPKKDYLSRNMDIIVAGEILIATPKEYHNVRRSGTWYTIRHAEGLRPVIIVYPDGSKEERK